jgi:DNA modification methylase
MSSFAVAPRNLVLVGDAQARLSQLPAGSIDCVVTSPPYWALRNYDVPGQIGQEPTVDEWVANLRHLMREVHRVLTPTGVAFLNLGDTFSAHPRQGAPRKSLMLGPERLALGLLVDGFTIRNKVIWHKPNGMPTSVRDRLACTWEYLYVLVKQPVYFFDLDAVRVPHTSRPSKRERITSSVRGGDSWRGPNAGSSSGLDKIKADGRVGHIAGRNPGDVLRLASSNYRGPHRATFPVRLADWAIRAGCPEARCTACRAPWRRPLLTDDTAVARGPLAPVCGCGAPSEPGLVADPFIGSGTTGVAAEALGRDWLGVELNPRFARLAEARIRAARTRPDHQARPERAA